MALIWNGDALPATGSTHLSVQEHEPFLRELTNTVSSTLAFCVLHGGPTLQVCFLPAPDAARVHTHTAVTCRRCPNTGGMDWAATTSYP
jgi:hypothetical protein